MWKHLCTSLAVILLAAGLLTAADNSWMFPVPTLGGLTAGDLIYARDSNNLGNISAVGTGNILSSAGTSTQPTWSTTPFASGLFGLHERIGAAHPTGTADRTELFASEVNGKTVLYVVFGGGSAYALATQP